MAAVATCSIAAWKMRGAGSRADFAVGDRVPFTDTDKKRHICNWLVVCIFVVLFGTDLDAARRACDRAVDTLLTSRDPVELQRSSILIRALDCSVSRRLPREP